MKVINWSIKPGVDEFGTHRRVEDEKISKVADRQTKNFYLYYIIHTRFCCWTTQSAVSWTVNYRYSKLKNSWPLLFHVYLRASIVGLFCIEIWLIWKGLVIEILCFIAVIFNYSLLNCRLKNVLLQSEEELMTKESSELVSEGAFVKTKKTIGKIKVQGSDMWFF